MQRGDKDWLDLVGQCRTADMLPRGWKRNWALGDLACQIPAMDVEELAEDVEMPFKTLRNYRIVSAAWSHHERDEATTWGVYQDLASRKHLMKPGISSDEARALIRQEDRGTTQGPCGVPHQTADSALLRRVTTGLSRLTGPKSTLSNRQRTTLMRLLEDSLDRLEEES